VLGPAPPQPVADSMHRAWAAFAATGDPGWPAYDDPERLLYRFGPSGRLISDDQPAERSAWARP
jgi:para-nitrobenzyl esterase